MSCNKCKDTDFLVNSIGSNQYNVDGVECKIFVELRMDRENNELDMDFGLVDTNNNKIVDDSTEWSNAVQINYCPFCGEKLD